MSHARSSLLLVLALVVMAGCSPSVAQEQPVSIGEGTLLVAGQTVGQTFVARDNGLEGIQVYLIPDAPGNGEIRLHLLASPQSSKSLATATFSLEKVTAPSFYSFSFPPQDNSSGQAYYFCLDLQGDGKVRVGNASGDTYLEGGLYQDNNPLDAQMSFRLLFAPSRAFSSRLAEGARGAGVLIVAFFLFILPGLALLTLWSESFALSWAERVGLAIGLSLALYPVLILWTNLAQLHLGALYAWLPGLVGLAVLIWRNRTWRPVALSDAWQEWRRSGMFLSDSVLLVVIGLVFFVRFWPIRRLDAPLWGDSYQHTLIAQLLVDHGGLFDSWKPYADIQSFTYHFGFHTAAAAFHWITGVDASQAVLWTGQILNGLAVLALYPLAVRVGGNRWAGVGAVLLAGLLAPMPMYYLNWGRYTQLAGQAILPSAVYIIWTVLEASTRKWGLLILAWIVIAGLGLTHYRILILALLFILVLLLLQIRKGPRKVFLRTLSVGLGGGLLFLPWFIHAFAGKYLLILASQVTTVPGENPIWLQTNGLPDLDQFLPAMLWLLLFVSIGWGVWRRNQAVLLISLWWFAAIVAANPQWLGLPGAGVLSSFAVFIAIYIPLGILGGAALGWLVECQHHRRVVVATISLLLFGIALWGTRQRLADVQVADATLVTRPDANAAAWIRENTPSSARFLINSFLAYSDTVVVGSDGGWWLPFLANRQNSVPPINYASEQGPRPDYREWVNKVSIDVATKGIDHPDVLALLQERGIGYVYIGQRQGRVNYNGPTLDPQLFLSSPHYRVLYHQDRVWVFEIVK